MHNPEKYNKVDEPTHQDASIFLPKAYSLMNWPRNVNVLDYGCGPGKRAFTYILPQVEKCQGQLYSVDISEEMVLYAKNNYPHPRVHYEMGNILENFPFKSVKFDNIISFYVLHHIGNIRWAFHGFHQVLNEGGHLAFMALTANSIYTKVLRKIAELDRWKKYMGDYQQFMVTWSEYPDGSDVDMKNGHFISLLEQCGFETKYLQVVEKQYDFDSMIKFLELCMVVNPFVDRVPEKLLPILKEDYRIAVSEITGFPENSKTITVTSETVTAVVQKSLRLCHK